MINSIFQKVLSMGLSSSWLIIFVCIISHFSKRIPRKIVCLFWSVIAVKLILPVSLIRPFGLNLPLEMTDHYYQSETKISDYLSYKTDNNGIWFLSDGEILHGISSYSVRNKTTNDSYLIGLWLIGILLIIVYSLISEVKLARKLNESMLLKENIYLFDGTCSSFIHGILQPKIYLFSGLNDSEQEMVLFHEKAHIERKDHIFKLLAFFLLIVYWFNPLCWIAYYFFERDMELACDEKVVRDMDIQFRKDYCKVLLTCCKKERISLINPVSFGRLEVKRRVRSILNNKKPSLIATIVSLCLILLVGIYFLSTKTSKGINNITITDEEALILKNKLVLEDSLKKEILNFDENDIIDTEVFLVYDEDTISQAEIYVKSNDSFLTEQEQNALRETVSNFLEIKAENVSLVCKK